MLPDAVFLGLRLRRALQVWTIGIEPVRVVQNDPAVVGCSVCLSALASSAMIVGGSYSEVRSGACVIQADDMILWFYGSGELWIGAVNDSQKSTVVLVQTLYRD